jgi:unsaturated chondroitin disaccharide hydrolase
MMTIYRILPILIFSLYACKAPGKRDWADKALTVASAQYQKMADRARENKKFPRSTGENGDTKWVNPRDWTSGFFPGALWNLYELTGDESWIALAEEFTLPLKALEFDSSTHDLGFMLYCSYGNAYRITGKKDYTVPLLNGANSLSSRFSHKTGCIRSWDFGAWQYPVIIDNMMNLEYLLWASAFSGNEKYGAIALRHADTTMINHFRDDGSCYHVVDYDTLSGEVLSKGTFQGYSDESSWSRGQSWALYSYTMMYRYTKERKYFDLAGKIAGFILSHPRLPKDKIPYWDFDAPAIPDEPRDAAAAAITASALLELSRYSDEQSRYFKAAEEMLMNLSGPAYLADVGDNNYFILKHSTGSKPHKSEVDSPLVYADYYYLEAMKRYRMIIEHQTMSL